MHSSQQQIIARRSFHFSLRGIRYGKNVISNGTVILEPDAFSYNMENNSKKNKNIERSNYINGNNNGVYKK